MINRRALLWLLPATAYLAFCFWYTDLAGPLTPAEIETYAGRLAHSGAAPDRIERMRTFMRADSGRQLLMVNVLDMAQTPNLPPGAPPDATAEDLLDHYMEHMYPALFARACHPVFVGDAVYDALDIVGIDGAQHWTRAALMRYRSRRDLMEIATDPAFSGRHAFKIAALEKTIAFPVEPVLYPSDARLLLFVLLLAVVAAADVAIYGRRRSR